MLLSVVVPVYNAEEYLQMCLNSLKAAWREGIEIILVDDGSKDSSGNMCDCFQKQHGFVKVVHQTNNGSVAARKKGVEEATGVYITSVDADDWVEQDYLEHLLYLLNSYKPDAVVTNFTSVHHRGNRAYKNPVVVGLYQNEALSAIHSRMICFNEKPYQFGINPSVCAKCFKKELVVYAYDQVPTDVSMGDDAMIAYPCLYNAKSVYISDHTGYNYRTNENSMTHTYNAKLAKQCVYLLEYMSRLAEAYKGNFPKQVQAYGRFITKIVFMNEFVKGKQNYQQAKEKFVHFLNQKETATAMKMKEPFDMSLRDRVFYRCLSWRILFLPYVFARIFDVRI